MLSTKHPESVVAMFLRSGTAAMFRTPREFLISHAKLASAFAVIKPGHMDGVETISFQFFTPEGSSAFKVFLTFGGKEPAPERYAQFHELRGRYAFQAAPAEGV